MARNKKGFTLVEVTVALAVFAILVTLASGIIISGSNIFARNTNRVSASETADSVYDILNERLSFATSIDLTKDEFSPDGDGYNECIKLEKKGSSSSGDERVSIRRENSSDFDGVCETGDFDVLLSLEGVTKTTNGKNNMTLLNVKISIYSDDELMYTKDASIELLNSACEITGIDSTPSNEVSDLYINYSLAQ
ncbi:MAG: prepilin-type N-terminal cleavage/methylation domain-containing protein [Ruminococcus sp.]|nr:prepilin-type N-terminal cleavage/methylation domain-containing protein [Ruminococcus sp.]